ncbi:MAG TPA: hypothetical protein VMV57_02810 [Terracidiphilus sp.]|nr:hypothetical protein [Terracidiphilus sp.]
MKPILNSILLRAAVLSVAAALLGAPMAALAQSGEVALGQSTVEPAFDNANGNLIYLLTPDKSPFPSTANQQHAAAPLYMVAYPTSSTIDASTLNCQPTNCSHLEVLPFPAPGYAALPGSNQACIDFNGSQPCAQLKGHDHLVGIASTGGDFNVDWLVELVVFTQKGFSDGAINNRVTTLAQIQALESQNDVMVIDTGLYFTCSKVSSSPYYRGTPLQVVYP